MPSIREDLSRHIREQCLKRLPAEISRLYKASSLATFKNSAQEIFNNKNDYPELEDVFADFDANTPISYIAFALALHFGRSDMAKILHNEGVEITPEMWKKAAKKNFSLNDTSMFRVLGDVDRAEFLKELARLKNDSKYLQFRNEINDLIRRTQAYLEEAEERKK